MIIVNVCTDESKRSRPVRVVGYATEPVGAGPMRRTVTSRALFEFDSSLSPDDYGDEWFGTDEPDEFPEEVRAAIAAAGFGHHLPA